MLMSYCQAERERLLRITERKRECGTRNIHSLLFIDDMIKSFTTKEGLILVTVSVTALTSLSP